MTERIHTLGGNAIEILSKPTIIGRRVDIFIFELETVCGQRRITDTDYSISRISAKEQRFSY